LSTQEGQLIIYDIANNRALSTLNLVLDADASFVRAAFTPDNAQLVLAIGDAAPQIYATNDGTLVRELAGTGDNFASFAFNNDGSRILGATNNLPDTSIIVWEAASGRELGRLTAIASDQLTDILFSPDGKTAFSASWDRKIRQWDLATFEVIRTFEGHTRRVDTLAVSADGTLLLSGSSDYTVRLWEVSSGQELARLEGHTKQVIDVIFLDNDTTALSIDVTNEVIEWRTETAGQLVDWVRSNRTVPELSCAQQAVYGLCSEPTP
jgi:WD40 repeat protein